MISSGTVGVRERQLIKYMDEISRRLSRGIKKADVESAWMSGDWPFPFPLQRVVGNFGQARKLSKYLS